VWSCYCHIYIHVQHIITEQYTGTESSLTYALAWSRAQNVMKYSIGRILLLRIETNVNHIIIIIIIIIIIY